MFLAGLGQLLAGPVGHLLQLGKPGPGNKSLFHHGAVPFHLLVRLVNIKLQSSMPLRIGIILGL